MNYKYVFDGYKGSKIQQQLRRIFVGLLVLCSSLAIALSAKAQTASSYISLPVQIDLRPLYKAAEGSVDTVYTSTGWPDGWVQSDCATRYKYRFVRQPLRISAQGSRLYLGFTGLYQIIGSTRACVNGTVLSPWTPACRCGFDEGPRKVAVGFTADVALLPNAILQTTIKRLETKPLDKCTVCFWGQDVTSSVISGLNAELDLSVKTMTAEFGRINLQPYLQQAWAKLTSPYAVPGLGYFHLQPHSMSIQNLSAAGNLLNLTLGLTASPQINISSATGEATSLPPLAKTDSSPGFAITVDAALPYDSLSTVATGLAKGKRIDISEGIIKKHIVLEAVRFVGDSAGKLVVDMDFSGSFKGSVQLYGSPVYNASDKSIIIQNIDYNLQTKSFLLNTAKWLFNKSLLRELGKWSRIPLQPYYDTAALNINTWLNKEWTTGVKGSGTVQNLTVQKVGVGATDLLLSISCDGKLAVTVSAPALKF